MRADQENNMFPLDNFDEMKWIAPNGKESGFSLFVNRFVMRCAINKNSKYRLIFLAGSCCIWLIEPCAAQ